MLAREHPDLAIEYRVVRTTGDRILDAPLSRLGGKGLFLKELEEALVAGELHCAVHSLKDVPGRLAEGCCIGAVTARADPFDVLCVPGGVAPSAPSAGELVRQLPPRARVGTSSLRRRTQLLALREDLEVIPVRGNVETRLAKLDDGEVDALVLASAGLARLGIDDRATVRFSLGEMVPAAGQGSLAVETLTGDAETIATVGVLDDPASRAVSEAERGFMRRLGGDCSAPVAAYARVDDSWRELELVGLIGDTAGDVMRDREQGRLADAPDIGDRLARRMVEGGGAELLLRAKKVLDESNGG